MKKYKFSTAGIDKCILIIFIFLANTVESQTWQQYHIPTGVTTLINFTYTSTGNSNNTSGNTGILPLNTSSDTSRAFLPLDLINDPSAYPWRTTVKIGGATGVMIDPYHVLTAGHIITFSQSFGDIKIIPSYAQGDSPYGFAYPVCVYLLTDYTSTGPKDFGIIKLDRPLGSITGWNGCGYNNSNEFFNTSNIFYNPSYPCTGLYNGEYLYNWKGVFNTVNTDYMISTRTGVSGMSGSCAFTKVNNENVVYGLVIASGIKFNRITAQKFDAANAVLNNNLPSDFDIIPFYIKSYPEIIKTGGMLDSVSFGVLNYSNQTAVNTTVTAKLYISSDSIITADDDLIGTYNNNINLAGRESQIIIGENISALNKPAGIYWLGVILSGDNNTANNVTGYRDCQKLIINNSENVYIKGRITSTQSNNGINGVEINGFPYRVITDYNGNFESAVPACWGGTITFSKAGYEISPSFYTFQNITSNTVVNFSITKKIYTVSGNVKSFISQNGVRSVKMSGLTGEPVSDTNGFFSANVFHGWSGRVVCSKSYYIINPYYFDISYLSSNTNYEISAGLKISGYIFNETGSPITNAIISGFPSGDVISGTGGYYSAYLDSGWSGTVSCNYNSYIFNPLFRVYNNIYYNYEYQDFQKTVNQFMTLKLKLFLGGPHIVNSDSMSTALNVKKLIPLVPPDSFSCKADVFKYIKQPSDMVSSQFLNSHPEIVDWILIEIRDSINTSIDTLPAFLCKDGRVINTNGDSVIKLRNDVPAGNYYIILRHRNHIAVMSAGTVNISSSTPLFDFSTGLDKYYGNSAAYLGNGIYGLFAGDANQDGSVSNKDFNLYKSDNINARRGYIKTDFSLDGFVTGSDFNKYAPNNKNKVKSKIL